ncbi:hypothetical protein ACFQGT_13005 [Natrialbaceae archaeon GCM10025810]|uniref:hypothetical protein n=1 Tax=Halovalidus salilacus TaxID=3075124 RepID=UPI00361D2F4D
MSRQSGTEWEFRVDGDVIVGEFPEETELSGTESDAMVERFTELLERPNTDAHVSVLRSTEPYSKEGQENLRQSALASVERGVDRWAVVAEGTKRLTMKTNVDVDGLDVETFGLEEKAEAIEWARRE